VEYLQTSKEKGVAYNATEVVAQEIKFGQEWGREVWSGGWETKGDTWKVVEEVLERWG
jgi:hypothetical protein